MNELESALAAIRARMEPLRAELAQLEHAEAVIAGLVAGEPAEPAEPAAGEPEAGEPEAAAEPKKKPGGQPGKRIPFAVWAGRAAKFLREQKAWDGGIVAFERAVGMGANTHGRKIVDLFKDQGLITTSQPAKRGEPTKIRWVGGDRNPRVGEPKLRTRTSTGTTGPRPVPSGSGREAVVQALQQHGAVEGAAKLGQLAGVAKGSMDGILIRLEREGLIAFERRGAGKPVRIEWKGDRAVNGQPIPSGQVGTT